MNGNLSMMTDYYELTMMQGYFLSGMEKRQGVFDLYYRRNPLGNGFAIAAGLAQAIDYIENLSFAKEDIEYLSGLNSFKPEFLNYLENFSFTGDIWAIPEGTVVFPNEPLMRITAPIIEAQLIETALLNIINHQCLIATKAARVVYAAGGDSVLEFGLRRAQGPDAGVYGARAAIIGGCVATSNTLCGQMFGAPVRGTHAHSWVMSFPDELSAFREYARLYPEDCTLLVDTYDTLKSGVPNAITVFSEMKAAGIPLKNYGVRMDSGDIAYISKKARVKLDVSGFTDAKIAASGDLDETIIQSLKQQNAEISLWGVGTSLITSDGCPAFGGIYKLAAAENENGEMEPRIKLSENLEKITTPGVKKVFRFFEKETGKIKADLISLDDETIDEAQPITIFDPLATWKRMTLEAGSFTVKELLIPIFINGEKIYNSPELAEIQEYCRESQSTLWDEHKRLINPHILPVDLSQRLYDLKQQKISEARE